MSAEANHVSSLLRRPDGELWCDREPSAGVPARPARVTGELDAAALARLSEVFRRDARWVFAMLRRFGLDPGDAEDVTQEVFLVLRARLGDVEPGEERKFLFRTAAYSAANARRAARRRPVVAPDDGHRELVSTRNAERELVERDELAVLQQILDAMPDDLRVAFILYEIEEMTLPEIADLLGIPLGTVKSRLLRARRAFEREARRRGIGADTGGGAGRNDR